VSAAAEAVQMPSSEIEADFEPKLLFNNDLQIKATDFQKRGGDSKP
jgi:hypothetical protein